MRKDETTGKLLKAFMEHRLQVYVGRDWLEECCAKVESSHERSLCWIQRSQRLVGGVSWRSNYNIVNNSRSVDAWRSLGGDVVGDAGSQRLVIMRVRMLWKGIRSSEGIVDELHLPQS